jgi:predicted secreted hydrolase
VRSPAPGLAAAAFLALAALSPAQGAKDGWPIPQPGHAFHFPADHGSHPEFRIEWWYVTGHLFTAERRRFGFQATFFRSAGPRLAATDADFGRDQVFLAHMAVTDVAAGRFLESERLNREGWDAGAAVGRLDVHNGEWALRQAAAGDGVMELEGGVRAEAAFQLALAPTKPIVVFGDHGVSPKGPDPASVSYYLTYPRLAAKGILSIGGKDLAVTGEAWMDHEISSSPLAADLVGWDWTCIQFRQSGRELMLYRLRRADGTADPASRLQWVTAGGAVVTEPFTWEVLTTWKNPADGAEFPARVRLHTVDCDSGRPVAFELVPVLPDQVLSNRMAGGSYWEGACDVRGEDGSDAGSAYLELTGYAGALKF